MIFNYTVHLSTILGHRIASTVGPLPHMPWNFETIVWAGRKRDKLAYERRYDTEQEAIDGHQEIVKYLKENPSTYALRKSSPRKQKRQILNTEELERLKFYKWLRDQGRLEI